MNSDIPPREGDLEPGFPVRFADLVGTVDGLPTLSALVWELQALVQDPQSDFTGIAAVIENDPSLAAHVLKFANSAHSSPDQHISSIRDAAVRMGMGRIAQLSQSMLVIDAFASNHFSTKPEEFWSHSVGVAIVAKAVCELHQADCPLTTDDAYIAGLLHDIGELILDQYFPDEFSQVSEYTEKHSCSRADAELKVLGIDHGTIGASLLEIWGLPDLLVNAIRYHHEPGTGDEDELRAAELIQYSDLVAHQIERNPLGKTFIMHDTFTLSAEQFESLKTSFRQEQEYFGLMMV